MSLKRDFRRVFHNLDVASRKRQRLGRPLEVLVVRDVESLKN